MHLVGAGAARVERSIGAESEGERVIGRSDFDDCAGSAHFNCVGIGACGVRAAAEDYGFRKELHAETGGGGEDAVHANSGRSGRALVAADHGLEQIGFHGLHADSRSL